LINLIKLIILHIFTVIFVYICKKKAMNSKMMASRQYTSNQMGVPLPKLGQKIKQIFKGRGGSKNHPGPVHEECSEHGCSAYDSGGGGSDVGSKSYTVKTSSSTSGEKNKVMSKRQADRRAVKFEKARAKAPAMKTMTKKQTQTANEMRPSRQDIAVPKASAKPAPQPKKTKKITF
jgi:hypothetical protein